MSDELQQRIQELQNSLRPKATPKPPPARRAEPPAPAGASSVTGRFACPVCSDRYPTLGDKKRHMRDRHPS